MEQALQQQDGAGDTTSEERPGETPQQREQRLASEAWLRRVPDVPGGLLRARLLLEYQRRQEQRK